MSAPLLHRLLGLAGIYALLDHQAAALRQHGIAIGENRAHIANQERLMSDTIENQQTADQKVEELSAKVVVVVSGVADIRANLEAIKNAQANPDDATTLSAAGLAALDGALAQVDSLAATFAPAATTEPATAEGDGEAKTSSDVPADETGGDTSDSTVQPRDLAPGETLESAPTPDGVTATPIDAPSA